MKEKTEGEILKEKLFNKKENGWNSKDSEQRNTIFEYAKGYKQKERSLRVVKK